MDRIIADPWVEFDRLSKETKRTFRHQIFWYRYYKERSLYNTAVFFNSIADFFRNQFNKSSCHNKLFLNLTWLFWGFEALAQGHLTLGFNRIKGFGR